MSLAGAILISTTIVSGIYAGGSSETTTKMESIDSCWKAVGAIQDTTAANGTKVKVVRTQAGVVLEYEFDNKNIRREMSCVSM
ncbi:hypothetical protein [Pseudomonas phage PA1C]|uniref:Uncharacterized protein n=1 Tax=Pseudomonas phage vB_PaeM_PS119XW TaxID=2601632 RepID=A0A5C1K7A7_9CAUD|nr:hypothetical protein PP933_gp268 [Pseudomonas phage vB_PaeM_PS119XW]QBX32426.1 hypothetical protein [Pseudomonas phage PA1C]QEM41997.1 hypothetical protein [Pseudomonas phage vB_PaeM_PS119XW]BEG72514.1 hypothetical protein RVBP21_1420 [Pseudomonas phage BRkr]